MRWRRVGYKQESMGSESRALLWSGSVLVCMSHPSEDVKEAVRYMCLELSRKVRARAINLEVISV